MDPTGLILAARGTEEFGGIVTWPGVENLLAAPGSGFLVVEDRAGNTIGSVVEDNRFSAEVVARIIGDLKKEMSKLESLVGDKVHEAEKLYRSAKGAP